MIRQLISILETYQRHIFIILGLLLLLYLRQFLVALDERHSSIFGLERETAQRRLNSALAMIVLIVLMAATEFIVISLPQRMEAAGTDLAPVEDLAEESPDTGTDESIAEISPADSITTAGCIEGQLEWIDPSYGEEISGLYPLRATINVKDQGRYDYSYMRMDGQHDWVKINGGSGPVIEDDLTQWATAQADGGDGEYALRIQVYNIVDAPLTPCDVVVTVNNRE